VGVDVSRAVQKVGDGLQRGRIVSIKTRFLSKDWLYRLTMVSLNDLYLVVTSGPVVSIVGTTRVGMVPARPISQETPDRAEIPFLAQPTIGVDPTTQSEARGQQLVHFVLQQL
jgi:hypothetical protein